jgi:hypothetical protein
MTNTIVANNTGDNTPSTNGDCLVDDEFDSSANNLDTDGSCAAATNSGVTTVTPAALALGPLANNGGNTSTRAIPVTSAALNAGNNSTCESTDQRGISRPQGATCDIGAFEQDDFTAPVTVIGAHPKRVTTKRMARFTFSGEPGSTFRCRWDRKAYRACASPKRFRVGLGRHKFRVFAIDKAGNVDTTPVVFRWKVVP